MIKTLRSWLEAAGRLVYPDTRAYQCSFCQRPHTTHGPFVEGLAGVFICRRCLQPLLPVTQTPAAPRADVAIALHGAEANPYDAPTASTINDVAGGCSFCGTQHVKFAAVQDQHVICVPCVERSLHLLDEAKQGGQET